MSAQQKQITELALLVLQQRINIVFKNEQFSNKTLDWME